MAATKKSKAAKPAGKSAARRRSALDSIPGGKYSIGALLVGAVGGLVAWLASTGGRRRAEGHVPTDLTGDDHPGPEDRAPEHFRPDPTAPVAAEDRDALRPALARPTLVS